MHIYIGGEMIGITTSKKAFVPFTRQYSDWRETFIVWPRKINGRWLSFTTVYCRDTWLACAPRSGSKEYTDLFGVLKS